MDAKLKIKVLKIAAQICSMHGSVAGDRICQDWSGDTAWLDSLTDKERDELQFQFEQWNSNGNHFEPGYFPYDEMVISFIISHALEIMFNEAMKNDQSRP